MAADIDVRAIATFAALPDVTINTLIDNPTVELVKTLLQSIEKKAKEFEQTKTQKVKLEVELETVVRTHESKSKVLQSSRDKALADVSSLRNELQAAESSRLQAQSDLERFQQSLESDAAESSTLKSRISSLEASNRDTLALVDSKSKENDRLSQDVAAEHAKVVELRKQVSTLEQANQIASSATTSAKFKQASLENEVAMKQKSIDWLEEERKAKADEYQKFRREKNARVAELQLSLEQQIEQNETLRRSENTLRSQSEEQVRRSDEFIRQIQKAQEKEISDAENHRVEIDSLRRLVDLHKASADRDKARVDELTASLDEARDEAAEEIGRIRAESQEEHLERQAAERRITELESRISELESELHSAQTRPATPHHEANGQTPSTPLRPGTPLESFTPRSTSRLKNGTSMSQLYTEYRKLERELGMERRTNEDLQAQVESMVNDLEANRPAIEELRNDQAQLQSELVEMSALNEQVNKAREVAVKETNNLKGKITALEHEVQDAQQMVRDRNSQVRRLLLEQQAGSISDAEYKRLLAELEQIDDREMEHLSATQQEVNRYLIAFRNIAELQSKNEELLKTTRNLVTSLEENTSKETAMRCQKLEQDLSESQQKVDQLQNEVNGLMAQAKTFGKERDMFRGMLTRRGQLPADMDPIDFSRSMPLPAAGHSTSILGERASPSGDGEYVKLLKDLQSHFDNYRRETATDTNSLKKQVTELSQRNSSLQAESSRSLGQVAAANERYEMLQSNFNMLKFEHNEMQKRSQDSMENATKKELKLQQATEDLVEARGMMEGLRTESANLKAEKDLWKSIEKRLIDDNELLRNDRSRVEQLNTSLQTLLAEKERDDAESRRRLQSRIDSLETELHTAQRKLDEELEEKKQSGSRRSYELDQSQKRIDDLVASLSSTREDLAAAKTARDHLQARVDELAIELRAAEEKLLVFSQPSNTAAGESTTAEGDSISREQGLAVEVSELKRDLELKANELARAEEQMEDYKAIAQSAEERLQQFTETNDEDKADLQKSVNEKEEKIKDLEQRIDDISNELNTSNSELSKLRDEQAESTRRLEEQKAILQSEIDRLKDSEQKALEQANFNLEASKTQAEIATAAQESYDNELLKHAEAAKTAKIARDEANRLRIELVEARTQAQTATDELNQKESSWADMEARLKGEITEIKVRREEAVQQNNILHGQLESLTQQISTLQQKRNTADDEQSTGISSHDSQDMHSLQEVINYLRREKEIVEVQYHLSSQEAKRFKQQLDLCQSQLEETRLKLDQQRRADINLEKNALDHNKLMETINQMNLYRESSVTLRSELKQAQQLSSEKAQRVQQLEQEIIPLRARVVELEHMIELKTGEMDLLQKDRDGWQQRTQNILSKYDRVDPAELEELKTRISSLEQEKQDLAAERDELQVQVDAQPDVIALAKKETKEALSEQFKARDKRLRTEMRETKAEAEAASNAVAEMQKELDSAKEELQAAQALADSQQASTTMPQTAAEGSAGLEESRQRIQELETKIAELENLLAERDSQISQLEKDLESNAARLRETSQPEGTRENSDGSAQLGTVAEYERKIQELKAEHQQEVDALRAAGQTSGEATTKASDQAEPQEISDAEFDRVLKVITDPQARKLVHTNDFVKNICRNNIKKAISEERNAIEEEKTRLAEEKATLTEEKERLLSEKDQEFELERENILKQHQDALEAQQKSLEEETQQKVADEVAKSRASTEKMHAMKLNMLQKTAANNTAKLNAFKVAATDTPERPIKEVYEEAIKAKPQDTPKPASASAPASDATKPAPESTKSTGSTQVEETKVEPTQQPNGNISTPVEAETQVAEDDAEPTQTGTTASSIPQASQPAQSQLPRSGLPRGTYSNSRGQGRGGAPAGRGTNIPRPNSAFGQNSNNTVRGGGRGQGQTRGGGQQTNAPRGGGNANLNPAAQQFTPGKRAREEDESNSTGIGKRIRGGGAAGS